MPKLIANGFLTVVLVVGAYSGWNLPTWLDDHRCWLDNVSFGTPRSGVVADVLQVRPGEAYWLSFNLRGCTPDARKTCHGEVTVRVDGASPTPLDLSRLENSAGTLGPFQFQKRTGRTFLDYNFRGTVHPEAPPGPYVIVIHARDFNSGRTNEDRIPFEVVR